MNQTQNKQTQDSKPNELEQLRKQLAQKEELVKEHENQLKRLQAEFENYMKRAEKEKQQANAAGAERVLKRLLALYEDFKRAIIQASKEDEFTKGIKMIYNNLAKYLEEEGITAMNTVGKCFDSRYHEVVQCIEKKDCKENTILQEVQPGYLRKGEVFQHAKVVIAKSKTTNGG